VFCAFESSNVNSKFGFQECLKNEMCVHNNRYIQVFTINGGTGNITGMLCPTDRLLVVMLEFFSAY
jgi:hypothetical protein